MGRGAVLLALGALAARSHAQTFMTDLKGLGGTPIGLTKLNEPGTSLMNVNYLTQTDSEAVCNDGSPAAYYFAPATSSALANTWLVYLEGSMFCWSGESCHDRYQTRLYWMSSTTWAPSMAQGGIFSTDPTVSPFATANRVYVKYCSSDLWSGDVAASQETFGFAFRGSRIVAAVIDSLVANHGMGSAPGSTLLFGGCSAGAIGAMNKLDSVAQQVPSMQVKGFLDAAALVDIFPTGWPWSPDLLPLQLLVAEMVQTITPTFDPTCSAMYPGTEQWKCLWGQFRMPLLQTPFFMNAPQYDDFEIMYETDNLAPSTAAQMAFVNSFQPAVLSLIDSLPAGTGVYSPTCLVHCLSGQDTYQNLLVNGISMSQAFASWWSGTPTSVVSPCQGWECVNQCGVDFKGLGCNTGDTGCYPIQLPTETSDEPPPATSEQEQLVVEEENALNSAQLVNLQAMQQQQQQQQQVQAQQAASTSRRILHAAETCCGRTRDAWIAKMWV